MRNTSTKTTLIMSFWYRYNFSKVDVVVESSSLTETIYCSGIKKTQSKSSIHRKIPSYINFMLSKLLIDKKVNMTAFGRGSLKKSKYLVKYWQRMKLSTVVLF